MSSKHIRDYLSSKWYQASTDVGNGLTSTNYYLHFLNKKLNAHTRWQLNQNEESSWMVSLRYSIHCYFQIFAIVKQLVTNIDYFINIWQVARKLSCGDIPARGLGHMQYIVDVFCDITSFDMDGGSPNR